jgi:hypothetical protein
MEQNQTQTATVPQNNPSHFNLKLKTRFWMPLQHSPSKQGLTDAQVTVSCGAQIKAANITINIAVGN